MDYLPAIGAVAVNVCVMAYCAMGGSKARPGDSKAMPVEDKHSAREMEADAETETETKTKKAALSNPAASSAASASECYDASAMRASHAKVREWLERLRSDEKFKRSRAIDAAQPRSGEDQAVDDWIRFIADCFGEKNGEDGMHHSDIASLWNDCRESVDFMMHGFFSLHYVRAYYEIDDREMLYAILEGVSMPEFWLNQVLMKPIPWQWFLPFPPQYMTIEAQTMLYHLDEIRQLPSSRTRSISALSYARMRAGVMLPLIEAKHAMIQTADALYNFLVDARTHVRDELTKYSVNVKVNVNVQGVPPPEGEGALHALFHDSLIDIDPATRTPAEKDSRFQNLIIAVLKHYGQYVTDGYLTEWDSTIYADILMVLIRATYDLFYDASTEPKEGTILGKLVVLLKHVRQYLWDRRVLFGDAEKPFDAVKDVDDVPVTEMLFELRENLLLSNAALLPFGGYRKKSEAGVADMTFTSLIHYRHLLAERPRKEDMKTLAELRARYRSKDRVEGFYIPEVMGRKKVTSGPGDWTDCIKNLVGFFRFVGHAHSEGKPAPESAKLCLPIYPPAHQRRPAPQGADAQGAPAPQCAYYAQGPVRVLELAAAPSSSAGEIETVLPARSAAEPAQGHSPITEGPIGPITEELIESLRTQGWDVEIQQKEPSQPPRMVASRVNSHGDIEIVMKGGATAGATDAKGRSAKTRTKRRTLARRADGVTFADA